MAYLESNDSFKDSAHFKHKLIETGILLDAAALSGRRSLLILESSSLVNI